MWENEFHIITYIQAKELLDNVEKRLLYKFIGQTQRCQEIEVIILITCYDLIIKY